MYSLSQCLIQTEPDICDGLIHLHVFIQTKRRSGGGQKSTSFSGPTKPSKSQPFESSPPHHHETDEEPPQGMTITVLNIFS